MVQGVIKTVKDLVVTASFDDDCPDINEIVIVDNPNKAILLVDSVGANNVALCLNIHGDRDYPKRYGS